MRRLALTGYAGGVCLQQCHEIARDARERAAVLAARLRHAPIFVWGSKLPKPLLRWGRLYKERKWVSLNRRHSLQSARAVGIGGIASALSPI